MAFPRWQGDDQAGGYALPAQALDGGFGLRGVLPSALEAPAPPDVVELPRAIDGDPNADLVAVEHPDVVVVDQHAVGLDAVGTEALQPPGPECLKVVLGDHERLATEEGERSPFALDGALHGLQVVGAGHVARVALGVLVAVLALDVAGHPGWSQLDGHGASGSCMPKPRLCGSWSPLIIWRRPRVPCPRAACPRDFLERSQCCRCEEW